MMGMATFNFESPDTSMPFNWPTKAADNFEDYRNPLLPRPRTFSRNYAHKQRRRQLARKSRKRNRR